MKRLRYFYIASMFVFIMIAIAAAAVFVRAQALPPPGPRTGTGTPLPVMGGAPAPVASGTPTSSGAGAGATLQFPPAVPSSTLPDYLGSVSDIFGTYPTGPTLAIGTPQGIVSIRNIYSADMPVNEVQDLVFKETQDYLMVYNPLNSHFWIAITGSPFATWRAVAEKDFLVTLGISETDACRLSVTEGVIYSAGNPNDGLSFPMTSCGPSPTSTGFSQ